MKTILRIILLSCLLLASATAYAASFSVTLAWDASPSSNIVTYTIYHHHPGAAYASAVTVSGTNLTATVTNLPIASTNFFVATATDSYGLESEYSNEVVVVLPRNPAPPGQLRSNQLRLTAELQRSGDPGGPWFGIFEWDDVTVPVESGAKFYKVVAEVEQ